MERHGLESLRRLAVPSHPEREQLMGVTGMNESPRLSVGVCKLGDTRRRIMQTRAAAQDAKWHRDREIW